MGSGDFGVLLVASEVAVAEVIGVEQEDVRPGGFRGGCGEA